MLRYMFLNNFDTCRFKQKLVILRNNLVPNKERKPRYKYKQLLFSSFRVLKNHLIKRLKWKVYKTTIQLTPQRNDKLVSQIRKRRINHT